MRKSVKCKNPHTSLFYNVKNMKEFPKALTLFEKTIPIWGPGRRYLKYE
jgi:hypothetical protein